MKVSKAAKFWIDYHKTHSKKNTVQSYQSVIERFCQDFGDTEIEQVTPDDVLSFLNNFTNGNKPYTKRVRYSHLSAFSIFSVTTSIPK
jgi:site-specific recombinase XerD